jgi:hypothetical protein
MIVDNCRRISDKTSAAAADVWRTSATIAMLSGPSTSFQSAVGAGGASGFGAWSQSFFKEIARGGEQTWGLSISFIF